MEPITDLGALLDAGDGAMVTLVAGDTHLVAHRAVLAARSPVFAAKFCHKTPDANSEPVCIPDVEGAVLRQLLAYMYTQQAPQLPTMGPQLLAAADQYGLSVLKEWCEQQLAAQLSIETVAATAVVALRHSCAGLRQAAISFIKDNFVQVMATQGWADAVRTQPEDVVELSRLLSQSPSEVSTSGAGDSGSTRPNREEAPSPVEAGPPSDSLRTPTPDDVTISRLRNLSGEEKNRRLIQAAKTGATEALQTLLAAGADVEAKDWFRRTPLHFAAMRGHVGAVRCLLESGAAVGMKTSRENTPLHWAAYNGHAEVVRLLTAASADPNARNWDGRTPLHCASAWGHAEVAAALLEAGADRGAQDHSGVTPLELARWNHQEQVVRILR